MSALIPPFQANSMEQLCAKITRGYYPPIPGHYSQDLHNVVDSMLQLFPNNRPNCEQILQLPCVVQRMNMKIILEDEKKPEFMKTIKMPKQLYSLTDRLPKANYEPLKTKKIALDTFLKNLQNKKQLQQLHQQQQQNNQDLQNKNPQNTQVNQNQTNVVTPVVHKKSIIVPRSDTKNNKKRQAYQINKKIKKIFPIPIRKRNMPIHVSAKRRIVRNLVTPSKQQSIRQIKQKIRQNTPSQVKPIILRKRKNKNQRSIDQYKSMHKNSYIIKANNKSHNAGANLSKQNSIQEYNYVKKHNSIYINRKRLQKGEFQPRVYKNKSVNVKPKQNKIYRIISQKKIKYRMVNKSKQGSLRRQINPYGLQGQNANQTNKSNIKINNQGEIKDLSLQLSRDEKMQKSFQQQAVKQKQQKLKLGQQRQSFQYRKQKMSLKQQSRKQVSRQQNRALSINLGSKKIQIPLQIGKGKKKKRLNIIKTARGKSDRTLASKVYIDQHINQKYKVKSRRVYERRKLNLPINNNVFIKNLNKPISVNPNKMYKNPNVIVRSKIRKQILQKFGNKELTKVIRTQHKKIQNDRNFQKNLFINVSQEK